MTLRETAGYTEGFCWPDSMWPIKASDMASIGSEFLPTEDEMQAIKYPWELWRYILKKMADRVNESVISDDLRIVAPDKLYTEGPIWVGRGVTIMPFAEIKGPAYIGDRSFIGDKAMIRGSYIGPNTVVGEETTIVRSVVGEGCQLHLNYIGDSLLAARVNMGGGTRTANVRIDDKPITFHMPGGSRIETDLPKFGAVIGSGTRIAAHCLTMPGLFVGSNCLILSGCILDRNLPDNTKVRVKQEHVLEPR